MEQLSCVCCAFYESCELLTIGEYCGLEHFEPSDDFMLFAQDLASLADGSSDEAEN